MGKSRQADFTKTKLRVGKHLPKGKNVTKTSFKTKKIVTMDQSKAPIRERTLQELTSGLVHASGNRIKDLLVSITRRLQNDPSDASMHATAVLNAASRHLLGASKPIRGAAIDAITHLATALPPAQMEGLMNTLSAHAACMATHVDLSVRRSVLELVDGVYASQQAAVSGCAPLVSALLDTVSSRPSHGMRHLANLISSDLTAQDLCCEVLQRVALFYEHAADSQDKKENKHQPYMVHLTQKGRERVPLRIWCEPDHAWLARSDAGASCDVALLRDEMSAMARLLMSVASGELGHLSPPRGDPFAARGSVFDANVIRHLSILVDLLCGWARIEPSAEDKSITSSICEILQILIRGFPFGQLDSQATKSSKHERCNDLNAGVCFLLTWCGERLGSDLVLVAHCQLRHLLALRRLSDTAFRRSVHAARAILLSSNSSPNGHSSLLLSLCTALAGESGERRALLRGVIAQLSEEPHLVKCEGMELWFEKVAPEEVAYVSRRDVEPDTAFLLYTRRMALIPSMPFVLFGDAFQLPQLIEQLQRCEEGPVQATLAHLLAQSRHIAPHDFKYIARMLRSNSLPIGVATGLLRDLNSRFRKEGVRPEDKCFFLSFLMNVSCDILMEDICDEEAEVLVQCQKFLRYHIIPAPYAERQTRLYQACEEYILMFYTEDIYKEKIHEFIMAVLDQGSLLKSTSVASVLRLHAVLGHNLPLHARQLLPAALIFSIAARQHFGPDRAQQMGARSVLASLHLDQDNALRLLHALAAAVRDSGADLDEDDCVLVLRVLIFVVVQGYVDHSLSIKMASLINALHPYCQLREDLKAMFENVKSYFGFF